MSFNSKKKNYLVREEIYVPTEEESLIFGLMGYAAYKLWNVANYERRNWKELGLEEYPDWYDQKKRLKTNFFYKNLPSQSAQRTLKKLDESWESYYALKASGGVETPNPLVSNRIKCTLCSSRTRSKSTETGRFVSRSQNS